MYSDFILERQPISVEDALEIFQDISTNFGVKEDGFALAAPKHVQLMPIKVVRKLKEGPVELLLLCSFACGPFLEVSCLCSLV